jgi:hypothetical protein
VDALSDYLIKNPGLTPPSTNRIRQLWISTNTEK